MRPTIVVICVAFLSATLVGCGGDPTSTPPANAKPGPPPGTGPEMVKPPATKAK